MKRSVCLLSLCAALAHGSDLERARASVETRQYSAALSDYKALLALQPRNSDLLIEAGRVAAWADLHPLAIEYYGRVLKVAPNRRQDVLAPLALQLHWANRNAEAKPLLREALSRRPADRQLRFSLAESCERLGDFDEAETHYRRLVAAEPSNPRASEALKRLELQRVRAQVDAKQYRAALAAYDALLAAQPGNADLLIEAGRVAGWGDLHRSAIDYYQRALKAAPGRRGDVLPALAMQLQWSGQPGEAEPLLRESLALQPASDELRFSLAEVTEALERHQEAEALYRQLLAEQPQSLRASLGLARTLSRAGRYGEARERYQALLRGQPDDREANWGLASAMNLDDYPMAGARQYQEARRVVGDDPALLQEYATALYWAGLDDHALAVPARGELANTIHRSYDPQITTGIDSSSDSDHVQIRALRLDAEAPLGDGQRAMLHLREGEMRDQSRTPLDDQNLSEATLRYRWQLGDHNAAYGVWQPTLSLGERRYEDWHQTLWKAQLRWLPADRWWLDAEAGNEVVETPKAIANRVELDVFSLSQTHRFNALWLGSLSESLINFEDGNTRKRVNGWLERRMHRDPDISLGGAALYFRDGEAGKDLGYYSPEVYGEGKLYLDIAQQTGVGRFGVRVGQGWLEEDPGASSWLNTLEGRWQWDVAADHRVSASAGWSDSRAASSSTDGDGYSRRYLSLEWNWRL